jgi:hypothetical protein
LPGRSNISPARKELKIGQIRLLEQQHTFVVGAILDVNLQSERLHLLLGVCNIDQITEGDTFNTVAGGADLLVYLIPAANRGIVEGVEGTFEIEAVAKRGDVVLVAEGSTASYASNRCSANTLAKQMAVIDA